MNLISLALEATLVLLPLVHGHAAPQPDPSPALTTESHTVDPFEARLASLDPVQAAGRPASTGLAQQGALSDIFIAHEGKGLATSLHVVGVLQSRLGAWSKAQNKKTGESEEYEESPCPALGTLLDQDPFEVEWYLEIIADSQGTVVTLIVDYWVTDDQILCQVNKLQMTLVWEQPAYDTIADLVAVGPSLGILPPTVPEPAPPGGTTPGPGGGANPVPTTTSPSTSAPEPSGPNLGHAVMFDGFCVSVCQVVLYGSVYGGQEFLEQKPDWIPYLENELRNRYGSEIDCFIYK